MKFSICIPCYEMSGRGGIYLDVLLQSVQYQDYKNLEVVISDHSQDDVVKNVCLKYSKIFDLTYIKNEENRGSSSANMNNCIKNAKGDIIKPIFQDDAFLDGGALSIILKNMYLTGRAWGGMGFSHMNETGQVYIPGSRHGPQNPSFDAVKMLRGENTFGCPSVMFFHKSLKNQLFDDSLVWLMDCEYYYRLWKYAGEPVLIKQQGIAIRIWGDSVTYHISEERKEQEFKYINEKHK
jgi:glycosyltransferase involved in cell wall biosynthesis